MLLQRTRFRGGMGVDPFTKPTAYQRNPYSGFTDAAHFFAPCTIDLHMDNLFILT